MIEHTPSHIESALYYLQCLAVAWPIKSVIAACAAFLATDIALIYWLMGMLIADLAFGLFEAFRRGKFSCRVLGRGILKIPCYCAYIFLVGSIDASISIALGVGNPLLELFISYLIVTDAVSVMGHMIRLGLPVPKQLQKIILHAQIKTDKEIDKLCKDKRGRKRKVEKQEDEAE